MTLADRLRDLGAARLRGMLRGIEKESLRALPTGALALTPHPAALGSPLTHPHITTDFSESQLELITGVHAGVEDCLAELTRIHQFVYRTLAAAGDERLWVGSMPCGLPTDETIPLGRLRHRRTSAAPRACTAWAWATATGGACRRSRASTTTGRCRAWATTSISRSSATSAATPSCCCTCSAPRRRCARASSPGASTACSRWRECTRHLPHATSLRMGRLGYQSEAQATLAVSYNGMDSYADSLHDALVQPYPPYEKIGIRNLGGEYNQLATTLLQIENEFYGTIRPKRVIRPGERPLHALRERGVEYIEVRCMDLDPFVPVGIAAATVRFLDVFLLHCLLHRQPAGHARRDRRARPQPAPHRHPRPRARAAAGTRRRDRCC